MKSMESILPAVLAVMQEHVAQQKMILDLQTKINMLIKNSSQGRLQQHENLCSKKELDREGMKQNHLYARVHKNPDALHQTLEQMPNEENWHEEEILISDEESELEKRMPVPEDVFDIDRPSKKAKIKKVSDTQEQRDPYALYQAIKEVFKEDNWQEEEILTSEDKIELEKGKLMAGDIFDKEISSKSAKIKKLREEVQEKSVSQMNHMRNVEKEKWREIRCDTKLHCVDSLQGWHSNDDIYMRQSIIMIIIIIIEHLQPNANKMVENLPCLAQTLEVILYRSACTKEIYSDPSTLKKRLLEVVTMN